MEKLGFLLLILLIPIRVYALELIPNSKSGILIEPISGRIVYEKEKDKELSIASMTKMVGQIIILDEIRKGHIKWDDIVTVSRNASDMGGSQIYLEEGEKMSVKDLMKGVSVASANDATVALAEYISGSEEKFVKRMNEKVKELGLKHTHFMNSTGLDEKNHYSSAYDMAMIAKELITNYPEILEFSSIYEDYLRQDTDNKFWLVNTNKLISQYEGTDGLKTGHTDDALYCLAATAKRNDLRLIAIVLGEENSKVRNKETIDLLDYGFNTLKLRKLKSKKTIISKVTLSKSNYKYLKVGLKEDLNVVEDVDSKNKKYKYDIKIDDIKMPVKKGDQIGTIDVLDNGKTISRGILISMNNAKKKSLMDLYKDNIFEILTGNV